MPETLSHEEGTAVSDREPVDVLAHLSHSTFELPMLPTVVWEVIELTAASDVDARKLSALIHRDPALASHVLRVANSPAYKPAIPIVSLQQAVSRLGIGTLGEIAFAVSLQSRVFEVPGFEAEICMLWQHAVSTGAYAKEIARMRRSNVEGAFLCGLLHDIGKPVVLQALLDLKKTKGLRLEPDDVPLLLEAHHTQVGRLIAEAWGLPAHVAESILYHHETPEALQHPEAVLITRFADLLSYHLLMPEEYTEEGVRSHPVVAELNLYPDDVNTLLARRDAVQHYVTGMS